jgi:hypothetical protein
MCTGVCVDVPLQLRLSLFTLKTIVKNSEALGSSYIQCGTFFKQQKLVKYLPLEKLEYALQHDSSKHTQAAFPQIVLSSGRGL